MKIDSLDLAEIKALTDWREAPLGALLLITLGESGPQATLRVQARDYQQTLEGLLLVDGESAGAFVPDHYLLNSVLDLGDVARIVAPDPSPFDAAQGSPQSGQLFYLPDNGGAHFVWSQGRVGYPDPTGFFCIRSCNPDYSAGQFHRMLDRQKLVGIAKRTGIERIDRSRSDTP